MTRLNVIQSVRKVVLQYRKPRIAPDQLRAKSAAPFYENNISTRCHRVRGVTLHRFNIDWHTHVSVDCWCNVGKFLNRKRKPNGGRLTDDPTKPICPICEANAVGNGEPTSAALAGRDVTFAAREVRGPHLRKVTR